MHKINLNFILFFRAFFFRFDLVIQITSCTTNTRVFCLSDCLNKSIYPIYSIYYYYNAYNTNCNLLPHTK